MPDRRPGKRGSFDSHFDELLVEFPCEPKPLPPGRSQQRPPATQEKLDLHAALFNRAWRMDG